MANMGDCPPLLRRFLVYMETVRGKSERTVEEYYLDIRLFLRYLKRTKGLVDDATPWEKISIADVDTAMLGAVTLLDLYDYLFFLSREREHTAIHGRTVGLGANARARKVASLKSFYKYLTKNEKILDQNPTTDLESPKEKKTLPRHLSEEESVQLLDGVEGENEVRDYCILTFFLNCGLRVSELCGINLSDIRGDTMVVTGKGNKERTVYLNEACLNALTAYLPVRSKLAAKGETALFITRRHTRITATTVKWLVKKRLAAAGLDTEKFSAHKLRHTAATLMYQNGVDVLALKEILGHSQLSTTQIYTHTDSRTLREASAANPLAGHSPKKRSRQSNSEEDHE